MDLSYFIHRIIWPNKEAILQNNKFFAHLITNQILTFAKKLGASKENKFVICLDSSSWRKEYFETNKVKFPEFAELTYKGNREKDETVPWDILNEITYELAATFKANSDFYVMKVDGAEADDIIAVLANEFKAMETIWVISPDKDFIQLLDTNVFIFDPLKNAFKPDQDVETFMKIHIMIGDKSDNIPAIKARLGEKTAIKILKDLDDLLATDPVMKQKYEFNENLIDFAKIPANIRESILREFDDQAHNFNSTNILKIFMKFGMAKLSEDIGVFKFSQTAIKTPINQHFIDGQKNEELAQNNLEDFFS
jgi:5'-3' exonuclease